MSFINQEEIALVKGKLTSDVSKLGKLYKLKNSPFEKRSVDHQTAKNLIKQGWEIEKTLATKTIVRRQKDYAIRFIDDVWCQLYNLGYRTMNFDEAFKIPYGSQEGEQSPIDIIAIDKETVFLIACRSSGLPQKAPSFEDIFDSLSQRIDGYRKVITQIFGKGLKVKFIFATRNLRVESESSEFERFFKTGSFYYNDNTYSYINSLIKSYKGVAHYQFLGLIFKHELINSNKIEIPCVEGDMGGKKYYMFSIEPSLLLKMGFVLHRTKANEAEFPTYQRLLVPQRLAGITKYIDNGGYFPNSIILNFSQKRHKISFEPSNRTTSSNSRFGILKIPNAYSIAYIIDGQHRLYGYANSKYKDTNTIPAVAFNDLSSSEQLEIFMDINQNQKAVSPSLRLDLEEDLFWDSDRADSRLKALRSSIIKGISVSADGALFNKISIGEDASALPFKPFYNALSKSELLPSAKGNKYEGNLAGSLYDITNENHDQEMRRAKKSIVSFINLCYNFVQDNYPEIFNKNQYFIVSPRGTFAFIGVISSLNTFISERTALSYNTTPRERFEALEKYLTALLEYIRVIPKDEEERQLTLLGSGADIRWLRFFQLIINKRFSEYEPLELVDWKERQDEDLQDTGRKYGIAIEKHMKKVVLSKIKLMYKENWELEINAIKRDCQDRAEKENEKNYKEGIKKHQSVWTEMFNINDYKTIIDKYWVKLPEDEADHPGFITFQDEFSIDIGQGLHGKSDCLRWISLFNSYRNLWAHEGTKETRLNREEVKFLERINQHFEPSYQVSYF